MLQPPRSLLCLAARAASLTARRAWRLASRRCACPERSIPCRQQNQRRGAARASAPLDHAGFGSAFRCVGVAPLRTRRPGHPMQVLRHVKRGWPVWRPTSYPCTAHAPLAPASAAVSSRGASGQRRRAPRSASGRRTRAGSAGVGLSFV
eukprot:scaffold58999_cov30-Tisochrysis_lutea.AAC.4